MPTFKKGVHPRGCKELTSKKEFKRLKDFGVPTTVYIPISQFAREESEILVQKGDEVVRGQVIAKATGKFGVDIHASISGVVNGIVKKLSPVGGKTDCVEIEKNDNDDFIYLDKMQSKSSADIIKRIKDAGIVGMGGAAFPTHFKLNLPPDKEVDYLVVNGAECEPYINCDNRLMQEYSKEAIEGVKIVAKAINVKKIVIGIEDNKLEAISALLKVDGTTDSLDEVNDKVVILKMKTKYPQGAEKMLIKSATGREVPSGKLPADVGCVVSNIHTCYQVYQAVEKNVPLIERFLTISGEAVEKTGNFVVPIGTLYEDLFEVCDGNEETTYEMISGGPMMGFSVYSRDIPVAKNTSSILFLKEHELSTDMASVCINCGRCAEACPLNLMPMYIDGFTLSRDYENAKKYGAMKCMECGSCAFVCPAKRPLVQTIRLAKRQIRKRGI